MSSIIKLTVLCFFIIALGGCDHNKTAKRKPVQVTTYRVTARDIPYSLEFIGTTQSISTVHIRARVKGFLVKRSFKEGSHVDQDQLLYIIDKRQYQANLAMAKAALQKSMANLIYQQKEAKRMLNLVKGGAVSKERYDQVNARAEAAMAQVASDKANVRQAELNLSYCTMAAPIKGRIGKTSVNIGNLVGGTENTKLATIVQLNPMYVVFNPSVKEFAVINYFMMKKKVPVIITLPNNELYQFHGYIDFVNNAAEKQTSTVMLRATIQNSRKWLIPNIYVKVTVLLSTIQGAMTIPNKAIIQDQGGSYVYLMGSNNRVTKQKVQTGRELNHQIVITQGIQPGDQVIIDNLQKLKPGKLVKSTQQLPKNNH